MSGFLLVHLTSDVYFKVPKQKGFQPFINTMTAF